MDPGNSDLPPGLAGEPGAGAYPPPGYPPPPGPYGYLPPGTRQPDHLGSGRFRAQNALELIDSLFTLYRENFLLVVAVSAVLQVPLALFSILLSTTTLSQLNDSVSGANSVQTVSQATGAVIGAGFILILISLLIVTPLSQAAFARVVGDIYLGRPSSVGRAYREAIHRLGHLIAAIMLTTLIIVAAALLGGIAVGIVSVALGVVGVVLGVIALVVVMLFVYARICLAASVVVLENSGGAAAISRSAELVAGGWRRTAGVLLLTMLLTTVLGVVLGQLATITSSLLLSQIVSHVVGIFTAPLLPMAATLIYYDRRIRREALDIDMLATSL